MSVEEHYQNFSKNYDNEISKIVPGYKKILDSVINLMDFEKPSINVLDIGSGTGNLAKLIKDKLPKSSIHCIDISEQMIETAKNKLTGLEGITFEISRLENFKFDQTYDAIISVLTLQNIQKTKEKVEFYKKIFNSLSNDGIFIVGAIGLGETEEEQEQFINNWISYMNKSTSPEKAHEVYAKYKEKDRPNKFSDEVQWLQNIGFKDTKIEWQKGNFAVFYGKKN